MSELIQVRKKAQLTLPLSVRQQLGVKEGIAWMSGCGTGRLSSPEDFISTCVLCQPARHKAKPARRSGMPPRLPHVFFMHPGMNSGPTHPCPLSILEGGLTLSDAHPAARLTVARASRYHLNNRPR